MILYYDGTLSGFLCLLGRAVKERIPVTQINRLQQSTTAEMFKREESIRTDKEWAATVAEGLKNRLGKKFMTRLAQALYSEEDGIELDLLLLTRHALHHGRSLLSNPANPLVNRVEAAALKTSRERHRLLGFIRFSRLADDSYLARCSPRTNSVPMLGSHFSNRLGDQRWLIVDEQRKVGVFGENHRWQVIEQIEIAAELVEHATEQDVANLWRGFYHSISNPDRHNPKLRMQFMPKHYWQYLTEMQPA